MSTLNSSQKNKKAKKKKEKPNVSFDDETIAKADEKDAEEEANPKPKKGPIVVSAEDMDEDDYGPTPPKKADKAETVAADDGDDDADANGTGEIKIKSKKEKEREKKEKEKAKKKAQAEKKKAAAKAAAGGDDIPEQVEIETKPTPAPAADGEEDDDEEDETTTGDSKNKKKKKKKKSAAEKAEAAKPKRGPPTAALKKLIEAQRAAEEEARRKEEEERRKFEEEQKRIEEEERKNAEARARKKEREREKKEQLKKEGKLLTKKQKEQQQQAQIRLQQMLEAGVKVEGLEADTKPKKVVYSNKKKKGPQQKEAVKPAGMPEQVADISSNVDEVAKKTEKLNLNAGSKEEPEAEADAEPESWEEAAEQEVQKPAPAEAEEDVKDSWDASDEEVKDSWDAPSEDEKPKAKAAAKPQTNGKTPPPAAAATKAAPTLAESAKAAPAKATAPAPAKTAPAKAAPAKPATAKAAPVSNGKASAAAKPAESESESDDDSEEESSEDDSSEDESEEESSDEETSVVKRQAAQRKAEAAERRQQRHKEALAARSKDDLRSPICCILGHVDTGKTKLLDKIRSTNVQDGEAGGITQQIGATYFPMDAIKAKTLVLNKDGKQEYKVPGLLIIDTPGHESFTNLRSRGSSLCNIAILVVDIMHGLEPQTLESLRLLRDRKTPFIVALNKIDRLFDWKPTPDGGFQESLAKQSRAVQNEFKSRVEQTIVAFAEQGLNAILHYENKNFAKYVSLVPTSAITGEGIPDMLMLLVNLTQQRMSEQLMYLSELEATVLEVKVIEGLGTTIDVVLSNGILREGDRIVICGLNGPIVTNVRALLTPQPLKEMRVKGTYVHHKMVKAALGVKITAPDLEKAIAGSRLMVVGPDDDEDEMKEEIMSDLVSLLNSIDKSGKGVCVQASTLGSLEALLEFLKQSKIPVSGINIGPVHKRDIMRCATMLERAREFAVILCFDVKVDKEAEEMAEELGIKLFKADIIYHLFDAFTAYNAEMLEAKRKDQAPQAIFPCILRQIAIFNKRDPIIVGVDVEEGQLRVGTPICVVKPNPENGQKIVTSLGKVASIEQNHKSVELVKKGQAPGGVAVKIECPVYDTPRLFGRHFDDKDLLYSHMTRASLDVLKETFRNDLSKEEWMVAAKLKKILDIP